MTKAQGEALWWSLARDASLALEFSRRAVNSISPLVQREGQKLWDIIWILFTFVRGSRCFCLLLISVGSFSCVSSKGWLWIPEGWALFPQDNARFAHMEAENAGLGVVVPGCGRASAAQVKLKKGVSALGLVRNSAFGLHKLLNDEHFFIPTCF